MIENLKKSKLTIRQQNDVIDVILMSLSLTLDIFYTFFSVSFVDFEQVNVCWKNPWPEFWKLYFSFFVAHYKYYLLYPLQPGVAYLYPLKTSENL